MRIDEALRHLRSELKNKKIENAALEADLLAMHFVGVTREVLHMSPDKEIPPPLWEEVQSGLERRVAGEPLAYIVGYKDFYKHRFAVEAGVLIPRPDTELIVEVGVELQKRAGPFLEIADLGCGTGCIGLSLLASFPSSRLWACDISENAIRSLLENAQALRLSDRVDHSLGDVEDNKTENKYDLVVSNPPYIAVDDTRVADDVKKFEPARALFAAENGLEFYYKWLPWTMKALKPGGWTLFEVGDGQAEAVKEICGEAGLKVVTVRKDLAGIERVICARRPQQEE